MPKQIVMILLLLGALEARADERSVSRALSVEEPNSTQASSEQNTDTHLRPDSLGTKLSVKYECLDRDESDEAKILIRPSGQTLVGVCDVLFMLDANRNVVWENNVPQMLFDFAFVPSTGLIYGAAGDNNMFILEASSGKELVRNSRNGAAAYGQVKPYGNEICLITDNNWGYRYRLNDPTIKDGVTAWRGTEVLWKMQLPPGADLIVNGSRILALTKTKDGIFIQEIAIPKAKSR